MQNETNLRRGGKSLAPLWLLAALMGALLDAHAQAPANDNLTNAQMISGMTGTVVGNNQGASVETGEPAPVAGVPSGASIWYEWTAPLTHYMEFNTRYSFNPNNGSPLGTVMSVYSLPAGYLALFATEPAVLYEYLTPVTFNQQDPNTNSWPGASRVDFPAVIGTTYFIQVEGQSVAGFPNEGYISLNWQPSVFGGILGFTTNDFRFGQYDNLILDTDVGGSIDPSEMNLYEDIVVTNMVTNQEILTIGTLTETNTVIESSTANTGECRLTVTRRGGYNGRIMVDLTLTNDWYTNVLTTNIWVTNWIVQTISSNVVLDTNDQVLSFSVISTNGYTNILTSNMNTVFSLQYDLNGVLSTYYVSNNLQLTTTTTFSGNPRDKVKVNKSTNDNCNMNAKPQDFIVNTTNLIATNFDSTGSNAISYIMGTAISTYVIPLAFTNVTPSASNGVDYDATDFQTVHLDDFQMSQDAFVNVLYLGGAAGAGGPDWPDNLGNMLAPGIPRRVIVQLTNPRLDPLESLEVAPPIIAPNTNTNSLIVVVGGLGTIGTVGSITSLGLPTAGSGTTVMSIEDLFNAPVNQKAGTPNHCTTYSVVNFERRTFRCDKPRIGATGGGATPYLGNTVTLWVIRENPGNNDVTVNYIINQDSKGNPLEASAMGGLEAGADNGLVQNGANAKSYDVAGPLTGSITIPGGNNYKPQPIAVALNNNGAVEFDTEFVVTLSLGGGGGGNDVIGNIGTATVVVQYNNNRWDENFNETMQQPGGAADVNFNPDGEGYYDYAPFGSYPPGNTLPGANQQVMAVAMQPDGKSVVGGAFTSYDAAIFNYLVRTTTNGQPDFTFNPGTGPNDFVAAVAIDPNTGKIYIGGNFTSYNGVYAYHVARLNTDGSLDTSFSAGPGGGANGTVWALAVDSAGNVIIGGDFTSYNSTNRNHIARLFGSGPQAGSLDTRFDPGSGTDQDINGVSVRAVAADSLANVVLGGAFTTVNGTNWPGLARLTPTGALDTTFNPGVNADVNGTVYSLAVQSPGNQIVLGGNFSQVHQTNLNCIARLNFNGSVDTSFAPGVGVNGPVYAVAIQPDKKILLGGQFSSVETVRRIGYARLLPNGWVDTSFLDTSFNQFAGLPNHYYNTAAVNVNDLPPPASYNSPNFVSAMAVQPDGNVMIGGSFVRVGGGGTRDAMQIRWNLARVMGAPTLGYNGDGMPKYSGDFGLGNYPGNVGFTQSTYTADDLTPTTYISIARTNGSLGPVSLTMVTNLLPPGPGAASGQDVGLISSGAVAYGQMGTYYAPGNDYGWRLEDGSYGSWLPATLGVTYVEMSIFDNKAATQDLKAGLLVPYIYALDMFSLGGENIPMYPAPANTMASLVIIDDNFSAGLLGFGATNYNVVESGGTVTVTILRTNGSTGSVTVNYATQTGTNDPGVQVAIPNVDYSPTNGTLTFADGAMSASFRVVIKDFSTYQPNKFFNVVLSSPTHGAAFDTNTPPILPTSAIVTIVDNHFLPGHLSFTGPASSVTKGATATVYVQRTGGALGVLSAACVTQDGTGVAGINYTPVSNWLTWNDSDASLRAVNIPTLQDNVVEGTKTFNVILTNAIVANNGSGAPTNKLVVIYPSNAVVSIADNNSYGQVNFLPTNINVLQNGGLVTVTVARSGGTFGTISVNYSTADGIGAVPPLQPALAGTNYGQTRGTLTFGPGVTSQSFTVPIYYTPAESSAANRVIALTLSNPNPPAITNQSPFPKTGQITILDNALVIGAPGSVDTTLQTGIGFNNTINSLGMQPDGNLLAGGVFNFVNNYQYNQVARLNPDGSVDAGFLAQMIGSDGVVQMVLSQTPATNQTDGSIMAVGNFAHFDGVPRNNIVRLNLDGSVDESFNPGSGADNTIYAVVETMLAAASAGQAPIPAYIVAGSFANFNGVPRSGVARLTSAGLVDANFNPGNGVTSTNGAVHALALQADGKVILGGDFTSFNNFTFHHLVRLNLDGSVDPTFNADTGASVDGSVHAIVIQPDGQIVIGGVFTNVNGINLNHIARLNTDGSVDASFNLGVGANGTVETLALDSQVRILAGGEFTRASGVTRNGLTRLNPDGTVDPTINFGAGANGYVHAIAIQANDEINVGGSFTSFGGYAQNNFTRLYGGGVSGPGVLDFVGAVFGVMEDQSNAVITIQRSGGTGSATFPVVSARFSTADGTALNTVDYIGVTNTVSFPIGETFTNVLVPIIDNGAVGSNKYFNVQLSNPSGATLGLQASAEVVITNANAAVSFSAQSYRQSENVPGGAAVIPVVRLGDPYGTLTVTAYTGTNGSAAPGVDYVPTTNVLVFYPGVMTNLFLIPLLNNTNMLSDQTVDLELSNPVGGFLAAPSEATLTIATAYAGSGVVTFGQPSYTVSEGVATALITLVRTNGVTGPISVWFSTSNGTAIAGVNYQPVDELVSFSDGESMHTVGVPIIPQTNVTVDTTVYLLLTNPVGTTISGASVETLTIQNDIENFTMGAQDYFVGEGQGTVTVSIFRNGPTNGTVSVGYTTFSPTNAFGTNGYAIPGVNYAPASGTLTFGPGQTLQTVPITIYQRTTVDTPETFEVVLTNASAGTQVSSPGSSLVTIIGDVTGFALATNAYYVGQNGGSVVVTINRTNVSTGVVSVNYSTIDGTASNTVDYQAASGVLTFADGQASTNVTITILNPNILENNKTFTFALSHPLSTSSTNCYLLAPSNAVITITNNITAIGFSSPVYSVSESNGPALITVLRSGVASSSVSVQFATADGTGRAGTNYNATNGVLTFAPGVTSMPFAVNIIDDHIITANHTVYLSLSNPQGGAILSSTTPSVLTIQEADGSFVIGAGTALVSGGNNGLILPGSTVTVDLALRCLAGGNTTNLVATLQTNSSVTPVSALTLLPNVQAQAYGALTQGGPVAFAPFTFKVNGLNNQVINVTLQLQDGPRNLQYVVFSFTLGTTTTSFSGSGQISVPAAIYIPSPDSGPADPYPSTITVSGLVGNVANATVTISNLWHQLPSDIVMWLVSPATNVLLWNYVGGQSGQGVTNFSVTLDDSASNFLSSNSLVSGLNTTNKPTAYIDNAGNAQFLGNNWGFLPAMPSGFPANISAPYATNLSVLAGTAANGPWSLYVADTKAQDYGAINGGWSLNLSIGNPVPSYTDLELTVVPSPSTATASNYLTYTVALTNFGPVAATGVVITNILPSSGLAYNITNNFTNNFPGGTFSNNNGVLTFAVGALAVSNGLSFAITVMPTNQETITNSFIAIDGQLEGSVNNATNVVTTVGAPSADLGVTLNIVPNPVSAGDHVTITIVVTNNGPSIAYGTTVTNVLLEDFVVTGTNAPAGTTVTGSGGTRIWSIGNLTNNTTATLILTAQATNAFGSPVLDTAEVESAFTYDPFKVNNFASFKIVINPAPTLTIAPGARTNTFAWTASTASYVLLGATNLTPPVVWVPVTNIATLNVGGQYTITVPTNSPLHFFILRSNP